MDKFAKQLREDAARINVEISDELDHRISASLEGVVQERPSEEPAPARPSMPLWWASSLTGIAAAIVVIVLINLNRVDSEVPADVPVATPADMIAQTQSLGPRLNVNAAVLTAPLEQELADLESDLKKAEETVRAEIGLDR